MQTAEPLRTDHDIAQDLKRRLASAYEPVLAILDEANAQGFIVQSQIAQGPFDKMAIVQMQVLKKF